MVEPLADTALPAADSADAIRAELLRNHAELQRRVWARDPVAWIRECPKEQVWWGQKAILNALCKHRRVAVQSSNGIGKTKIAATACGWWLATHPPGHAFVLSSARTMEQVETRLWKEIHRIHEAGNLPGRLNLAEWKMPMPPHGREETVALGVKPADNDPSAIKGIHAPAVLVIFDEAQAMDAALWSAAGTITTSAQSRFLAIGNPDTPICRFYDICQPDSGWYHILLSAYDSPNFYTAFEPGTFKPEAPLSPIALDSLVSFEFVEQMIKEWGLDHPFYVSQVEGRFPESSEDTLIRLDWIRRAQQSSLEAAGEIELGVDVGGGVNKSVVAVRQGSVLSIYKERSTPDPSVVIDDIAEANHKFQPASIKVDAIGIGNTVAAECRSGRAMWRGHVLRLLNVIPVNVGGSASDTPEKDLGKKPTGKKRSHAVDEYTAKDSFGNLRAEGYWALRERFRTNSIRLPAGTPQAERLAGELAALKYKTVAGRIYIESKNDMKRRGKQSPDLADAAMLAFLVPTEPKRKYKAVWGSARRRQ